MVRFIGMVGMGSGFLLISPALRGTVMRGFESVVALIQQHGPYSYVLLALAFFGGAALTFNHSPRPQ